MRSRRTSGRCRPCRRPSCSQDGAPFLVTGSPGGPRIITTTLQIIMNVIDHGMNIAEATYAPRVHHQWLPDELRIEEGLSPDTIRLLEQKGHDVVVGDAMGSTQSIMVTDSRPVRQLRSAHPRRAHARLLRERAALSWRVPRRQCYARDTASETTRWRAPASSTAESLRPRLQPVGRGADALLEAAHSSVLTCRI